ncbi:MAG: hypothetical protein GY847_30995 [Proteobacteria bacterium]|nr:hypothetical protein [Pseudomonadota bacterium]
MIRLLFSVAVSSTLLLVVTNTIHAAQPNDDDTTPIESNAEDQADQESEPAPEKLPKTETEEPPEVETGKAPESEKPVETEADEPIETIPDEPIQTSDIEPLKNKTEKKREVDTEEQTKPKLHWRDDPKTLRHPGSYIGFGVGYTNAHSWFKPKEDEFDDKLSIGPFHCWQTMFRVGDAFFEWFALGFQIDMIYGGYGGPESISAFALRLDTTFYPWRGGLGIRPSVGLGFAYASGEEDYKTGYGGPASLSLALIYEIRLTRLLVLAPVAQVYWIAGEDFNGLFFFIGLEFLKWFDTPTG